MTFLKMEEEEKRTRANEPKLESSGEAAPREFKTERQGSMGTQKVLCKALQKDKTARSGTK